MKLRSLRIYIKKFITAQDELSLGVKKYDSILYVCI